MIRVVVAMRAMVPGMVVSVIVFPSIVSMRMTVLMVMGMIV